MRRLAPLLLVAATVTALLLGGRLVGPVYPQAADVYLNVTQGGSKKFGIAIPEFARSTATPDEGNLARALPEVVGNDLRFSALFSVVNAPPLPSSTDAIKQEFAKFREAGAHAAMRGVVTLAPPRLTVDFDLYDLTNPEFRRIAAKNFWVEPMRDHRRLAHRIADEVTQLLTGERGIAETKIAYVVKGGPNKEIVMMDYDGFNQAPITNLGSLSLSPAWSPIDATVAFTSYFRGYPYLFRRNPFNPRQRDPELVSAWPGINTAAQWSPDGKMLALVLSKDGNPEIYALRVGTSEFRRLTNHRALDTDPTWSPTGREIAFSSDRNGKPEIWVMDAEGANPRRLTTGFDTQPRWSPRGDTILFTRRLGGFEVWAVNPAGSNPRTLASGESSAWAPNGRHIVFASGRSGRSQLYTMLADGTEQQPLTRDRGDASSPTWSPRPQ